MKRKLSWAVIAVGLLTVGVYVGVRLADRPDAPPELVATRPAAIPEDLNPVERFIDDCLASRSLLDMASSPTYEKADGQDRLDLVQAWCLSNAPQTFHALRPDDRAFVVRRLKTQLDNLLVEREFDEES